MQRTSELVHSSSETDIGWVFDQPVGVLVDSPARKSSLVAGFEMEGFRWTKT